MIIRIVTFTLADIGRDDYLRHAAAVADGFTEWEGLIAKIWLDDASTGTYGGVYLFEDRFAADASRTTALFNGMASNPHFAELRVREFEAIDRLTAVTAAELLASTTNAAA
ncbi:MAG: YdhR family protein [Ilumatobacteraceae bacterium]